jgi:hypothetical protein
MRGEKKKRGRGRGGETENQTHRSGFASILLKKSPPKG